MEVMGLPMGEFIDDYTIVVKDVFAMPQSGSTVSVEDRFGVPTANVRRTEANRPVNFIIRMFLSCANLRFSNEVVVGWYHSHPGFGCWLSGVDINTQQVLSLLLQFSSPLSC